MTQSIQNCSAAWRSWGPPEPDLCYGSSMATRRGPELVGVYRSEVERVLHEDAFECAWRSGLYKFGRLSNRRILDLLRMTAGSSGTMLAEPDEVLLDRWFSAYSAYFHQIKYRRRLPAERSAS